MVRPRGHQGLAVGHTGHHLKQAAHATEQTPALFRLGDVQRAVIASGERAIYWVNPLTEQFATAYVERPHADHAEQTWDTIPSAYDSLVALKVEGMTVPEDRREGHSLSKLGLLTGLMAEAQLELEALQPGHTPVRAAGSIGSDEHVAPSSTRGPHLPRLGRAPGCVYPPPMTREPTATCSSQIALFCRGQRVPVRGSACGARKWRRERERRPCAF
jgi:hypothetical protein